MITIIVILCAFTAWFLARWWKRVAQSTCIRTGQKNDTTSINSASAPDTSAPVQPSVVDTRTASCDFFRAFRRATGMTPQQYREKWDLPRDYPMVAPNYAQTRSALAKKIGLGHKSGRRPKRAPTRRKRT